MSEFWNFKDVLIVATHNWLWLSLALGLGVVVGWLSCTAAPVQENSPPQR
jgi:hypothetical protein